ncbi:MAG: adenylosuccinate lyase [Alphaproteobacteria bacterium]
MIPRYSRPQMTQIWDDETKFSTFLEVEIVAAEALAKLGVIPESTPKALREKGKFDVKRIDEIEREVKHDVIAFLTNVSENVGEEARFMHQGMTSSDMLDTAFAVQLTKATDLLLDDMDALLEALKTRAYETKMMPTIGRSHGIHAEPTTMGLRFARFYAEFKRNKQRLIRAREEIATCAISGPVGTFSSIEPEVEALVAKSLGLKVEPISTQVIPRDRHAAYFATLGVIASSIENIATEVRHLQRTEIREAEEFFAKGQKGSSAMPHKRNPVLSENLTGLARLIRSTVVPAMENVALWHERDISHSSVERVIAPEATILLDFALTRLTNIVSNLTVYTENMEKHLGQLQGLVFSQNVLLALTQAGVSRENGYRIVQRNAMKVWDGQGHFLELLKQDKDVTDALSTEELEKQFDLKHALRNVDFIFNRVFAD